jgi:hypothetical protein
MEVPDAIYQEKIGNDLYSRIQAAEVGTTFKLLVQYKGPQIERGLDRGAVANAYRQYMSPQVKYYEENGVASYRPLELLGIVAADLEKRHVDDLVQNEEVLSIIDALIKVELIQ